MKLGSNLQYNLFNTEGWLGPETNPFTLVAGEQGAGVIPGYFMISYHYVFKNPVGQAWSFDTIWEGDLDDVPKGNYVSAVTLTESEEYGPGTVLQYKNGEWTRQGDIVVDDLSNAGIPAAVFVCS